jgi:hypothetical protein
MPRRRWPGPEYHVSIVLRAPLDFAFRWCTDFQADDARLEQEGFERKILQRTPQKIVYEDLEWADDGWHWAQYVVRLLPPNRWHAESVGNYRDATLDYTLTALPRGRTRFDLRWRRRPGPKGRRLAKAEAERDTRRAWRSFRDALERDYRATLAA